MFTVMIERPHSRLGRSLPALVLAAGLSSVPSFSGTLPIGSISLDPYQTTGATFDITNLTALGVSPVTTQLTFSDILLTVHFQNGGVVTESESRFTDDGLGGFSASLMSAVIQFSAQL